MLRAPFLTVTDVAKQLKVTARTVGDWIRSGQLRAIKAGKDWRIAQIDLEAFLDSHANRPANRNEKTHDRPAERQEKSGERSERSKDISIGAMDRSIPDPNRTNGEGRHS